MVNFFGSSREQQSSTSLFLLAVDAYVVRGGLGSFLTSIDTVRTTRRKGWVGGKLGAPRHVHSRLHKKRLARLMIVT